MALSRVIPPHASHVPDPVPSVWPPTGCGSSHVDHGHALAVPPPPNPFACPSTLLSPDVIMRNVDGTRVKGSRPKMAACSAVIVLHCSMQMETRPPPFGEEAAPLFPVIARLFSWPFAAAINHHRRSVRAYGPPSTESHPIRQDAFHVCVCRFGTGRPAVCRYGRRARGGTSPRCTWGKSLLVPIQGGKVRETNDDGHGSGLAI